jgi:hypothetical protein
LGKDERRDCMRSISCDTFQRKQLNQFVAHLLAEHRVN